MSGMAGTDPKPEGAVASPTFGLRTPFDTGHEIEGPPQGARKRKAETSLELHTQEARWPDVFRGRP